MGMSQSYGDSDDAEAVATIRAAIDLGAGMLDTSDIYGAADATLGVPIRGFGHNEKLIGRAISGRRDEIVVATKFGIRLTHERKLEVVGSPAYVRAACEASLRRLGTDVIDLYYCHRLDPAVPLEETVGTMAELVTSGKVRALGLSEVTAEQLRRAHSVHPISALQSEYSLWARNVEDNILSLCRELGVTFVPYSPLGRMLLTGTLTPGTTFPASDFRARLPRFQGDNLDHNLSLVEAVKAVAAARGCTAGQVALAWLLAQPYSLVPIPGTKRRRYLTENLAATNVALSHDDVAYLTQVFDPVAVRGSRYSRPGSGSSN